ncbi:DUF3876 domain-containing protein [Bacteroides reticulotermitis]|uniref:DUF3876 domain-containing protein n=1 Tax=Bacteroides reticulotermitis TaxID=1133319 RepID=UPI003A86F34F
MLSMATLLMESCTNVVKYDLDPICGNWKSVGSKPDLLIFKEGEQYKITIFKRSGVTRKVKPESYLIVQENGNLFINTGFRIDVAYNEATDVLSFSPNGDYTRVSNNE